MLQSWNRSEGPAGRRATVRRGWLLGLGVLAVALTGCDSIFEVENPNNIKGEDIANPAAASALVNGALGTVSRGLAASLTIYSTVGDEVTYIGSRDAWQQLNFGMINDPQNEFVNVAFPFAAQGRWMADETIAQLEAFDAAGELRDRRNLARAYLYGAIAYINIADTYDDFVFGDRSESAPPVGEANMGGVYDQAVDYLTRGIAVARDEGAADLELALLALRARAHHARAVWGLLNPAGSVPTEPFVASAEAVADAQAALALAPSADWSFELELSTDDLAYPGGEITLGHNINNRAELQFGEAYVSVDPNDPASITGVVLRDPVDDVPDPFVAAEIDAFKEAFVYNSITVASARELRLIIAEAALAGSGTTAEAVAAMNENRVLDGLTAYDPAVHTSITPAEMYKHERRRNLFLQNRRLADLYRYGERSPGWVDGAHAVSTPGVFFPIPQVERQSNCYLVGTCG